ncbi:MAG: hypothetical protein JSS99_01325 [Actinobacteria bacterium]|nr:hypothetical protein [Actinomycetota bacterium]
MRERTDGRPRAHQEPAYAFLDRAGGAQWERVRAQLDGWFARLPAPARADLRNRFAQDAELDHAGAFWELCVHELHRRRGFEIVVNIGCEAGERRQDFVLARGRERCWLEATVVGGDSPLSFTERRLDEQLRDILATVRAPRFSLALEVVSYGASSPGRRRIVPPLERWLGALDPRELHAGSCVRRLAFDDFVIDVEAIALPDELARPSGCAQLVPRDVGTRGALVNDVRPLRRKIKKKAARYGELDRPYLLAVLALGDGVRERDVEHALLGAGERDHAVWHGPGGPCNTRLSGVLVGRGLRSTEPFRAATAMPALWRNPWASRPLGFALPWRVAAAAPPVAA